MNLYDTFINIIFLRTNLSNSYSNDMLTVKLSDFRICIGGIFSRLQGGKLHIVILYSSTFYKKGHVIRRNLKIPNARVSRFVDWCAVMTLESFSCVFCQSKEFDRVTDWLKQSTSNCGVCQVSFYVPKWL